MRKTWKYYTLFAAGALSLTLLGLWCLDRATDPYSTPGVQRQDQDHGWMWSEDCRRVGGSKTQ